MESSFGYFDYEKQLEKYGDAYQNELARSIAEIVMPEWWAPEDWGRGFPSILIDNYPGQHLSYRRESYEKALKIVELLDERYQPRS